MCGRLTQTKTWEEMHDYYNLFGTPRNTSANYNAAPSQDIGVIRKTENGLEYDELRWGLIPFWAKDMKIGYKLINARAETVADKPSFRHAFKHRRCIIPASGFFEWKRDGKEKQPYYITRKDNAPMSFAGLWERWDNKGDMEEVQSFAIITRDANPFMSSIHNRMPVVLGREDVETWLNEGNVNPFRPCPDDWLQCWRVTREMNKPAFNEPAAIERI